MVITAVKQYILMKYNIFHRSLLWLYLLTLNFQFTSMMTDPRVCFTLAQTSPTLLEVTITLVHGLKVAHTAHT